MADTSAVTDFSNCYSSFLLSLEVSKTLIPSASTTSNFPSNTGLNPSFSSSGEKRKRAVDFKADSTDIGADRQKYHVLNDFRASAFSNNGVHIIVTVSILQFHKLSCCVPRSFPL